jgi:hypothetical protein
MNSPGVVGTPLDNVRIAFVVLLLLPAEFDSHSGMQRLQALNMVICAWFFIEMAIKISTFPSLDLSASIRARTCLQN